MSTYAIADAIKEFSKSFKEVISEKNKIEREKLEFEKMKFEKLSLSNSEESNDKPEEFDFGKKCKHDWEYEKIYYISETNDYKYKYVCNKCHEVRMVYSIKELCD